MKTYKFYVGTCPNSPNFENLEKWFEHMQSIGWELICPVHKQTNTNYASYEQGYIFRKEEILCKPNNINDKEG